MRKKLFFYCSLFTSLLASAQTQSIRGTIRDKESHQPLQGVWVKLITAGLPLDSTSTDISGNFMLANVPVGRQDFLVFKELYKPQVLNNIVVTSGKEVILNLELEDDVKELGKVDIIAKPKSGATNNEHALLSARLFTVEETDRYAGSRGDPARMASNFAGVQGADDSRNDIVVRGNSPQGILWRLEGVDIPNPNHFAIPGTTGGSVSILNNKILANSDFFTGAFPAEYGNSTAGVFDLKMRNGNNKKLEMSSQLGLLGWDFLAEGPLNKKNGSSFLFTYRYSTLALFSKLKIPIGTDAVPYYQDFSYKFNFPFANNKGNISFFGIGGKSKINILISDQVKSAQNLYGDNDRDQKFGSLMGVFGTQLNFNVNSKRYIKWSVAYHNQTVNAAHQLVFRHITKTEVIKDKTYNYYALDSLVPNLNYSFSTNAITSHLLMNTKVSPKLSWKIGLITTYNKYNFQDSNRNFDYGDTQNYWKWFTRWNSHGNSFQAQPYFQAKYKLSNKFIISAGLTANYFHIFDDVSGLQHTSISPMEPRAALRYQIGKTQSLNFATGLHSQTQTGYIYYYLKPGNSKPHNLNMGFAKSMHYVLGYDKQMGKSKRFHSEIYYQHVYQIPIETKSSSFSLANSGSGFSRFFPDTLTNLGVGNNYGIEFTFEKYFTKGFYYLATLSLFDAKYKGSDGVWRNSDFNTNYAFNGLAAKEWKVKNKNAVNLGIKFTTAGARRYSPMDLEASKRAREYIEVNNLKNTERFSSPYLRLDLRLAYRINGKKMSHEIAFDLVNVTNRKNVLKYSYVNEAPYFKKENQLGLLPLFYYKIDF